MERARSSRQPDDQGGETIEHFGEGMRSLFAFWRRFSKSQHSPQARSAAAAECCSAVWVRRSNGGGPCAVLGGSSRFDDPPFITAVIACWPKQQSTDRDRGQAPRSVVG
jgi:hypothetical protein